MTNTHILPVLNQRRVELANEIDQTQNRLRQMIADIDGLDIAIRLFDSDYRAQPVNSKNTSSYDDLTRRGDTARLILDILRQANQPLTISDIAIAFVANRGLDVGDRRLIQIIKERVAKSLRKQRSRGTVCSRQGPNEQVLWEINH
jgi:hypothetical protein